MRRTLTELYNFFGKYRPLVGLLIIFLAGALCSLSVSVWYFNKQLDNQQRTSNRIITRLTKDVDLERKVNRATLDRLVERTDKLTDDVGRIASAVGKAANTANQAATNAKAAAASAAKARIRVTETPIRERK